MRYLLFYFIDIQGINKIKKAYDFMNGEEFKTLMEVITSVTVIVLYNQKTTSGNNQNIFPNITKIFTNLADQKGSLDKKMTNILGETIIGNIHVFDPIDDTMVQNIEAGLFICMFILCC